MAVVGEQLLQPETGWTRYDDIHPYIVAARWGRNDSQPASWNGGHTYVDNSTGKKITFNFVGSKIRYIGLTNTVGGTFKIKIDGQYVGDTISCNGSLQFQILLFEKLDLTYGLHTFELEGISGQVTFDAVDIDETGYLQPTIGSEVLVPDIGWTRYDDTDPNIKYIGDGWSVRTDHPWYNTTLTQKNLNYSGEVVFIFKGTKLRLYTGAFWSNNGRMAVYIDDVHMNTIDIVMFGNKNWTTCQMFFEKLDLEDDFHKCRIICLDNNMYNNIDAIDIDSTGQLRSYDNPFTSFYLIKSSNTIYTFDNNTWLNTGLFEPLTKSDFETYGITDISIIPTEKWKEFDNIDILECTDDTHPKLELTISEQKPIFMFDNPKLLAWTDSEQPLNADINVTGENIVRYLISKDGINYEVYKNDNFTTVSNIKEGMTKDEFMSIPITAWNQWVGDEIYKYDLYVKIGIINQLDYSTTVKDMTITYVDNQHPVIINPLISLDSIHNEYTTLTATLKDFEGDNILYRVLIKKAGELDYYVVEDWIDTKTSEINIIKAYNKPYFNLGENIIRLEVKDQRGVETSWEAPLVMADQKPIINYTYNEYGFNSTLLDPESDSVSIQISINDQIILPYTYFMETPKSFKYEWDTKYTPFGQPCNVKIELKDNFGLVHTEQFTITGSYKSLLFIDEQGNYYTSDKGEILKMLDCGQLIAGQNTDPVKVTLVNKTNASLSYTKIMADKGNLPSNAELKISEDISFIDPKDIIEITNIFNHEDTKDFYVSIRTTPGRGVIGGTFEIKAEGNIVQ